jgi:hypothetical protein
VSVTTVILSIVGLGSLIIGAEALVRGAFRLAAAAVAPLAVAASLPCERGFAASAVFGPNRAERHWYRAFASF